MSTISEAFKKGKGSAINLFVTSVVTKDTIIVQDLSDEAIMKLPESLSKIPKEKEFIKVIKPLADKNKSLLVMDQRFKFVKGDPFEIKFKTGCSDTLLGLVKQDDPLIDTTLEDLKSLKKNEHVKDIHLKICYVGKVFQSSFSQGRNILAKDLSSSKVTLTLYAKNKDDCEMGKVYKFSNLKYSNYKSPSESFSRLHSSANTKTCEVPGFNFEHILLGDGQMSGVILGE